jgi:hypothetical protein
MKKPLIEQLSRMKHLMLFETGQYKPLVEDENPPENSTDKVYIDKKVEFGPGYYDLKGKHTGRNNKTWDWDVPSNLNPELEKIKEFLQKNPSGYIVNVKLYAGESQIPNVDRTKGGVKGTKVQPGYLSKARLNVIENYITNVLGEWKKQGIISSDVKVEKNEPVIGSTPWVGQDFCPKNRADVSTDPEGYNCSDEFNKSSSFKDLIKKYTDEQYLRVVMSVDKVEEVPNETPQEEKKDPIECAASLKIRIWVKSHNCQNAEFFVFANSRALKNVAGGMTANLNNASDDRGVPRVDSEPIFQSQFLNPGYGYLPNGDGTFNYKLGNINEDGDIGKGRSDTFIVSEQDVKDIINENTKDKSKISIWMVSTTTNAHKDIPIVTIYLGDEKIYDGKPKVVKGKLLTIDICTKKVVESNDDSQPDIPSLINKIVKEKSELQNKSVSTGKVSRKQKKKLDQKAVLLEKSEILLDKMTSLLTFLSKNLKKGQEMSDEVYKRIEDDYDYFKKELEPVNEDQPSFKAELSDGEIIFKDKTIRDNELYGDIRIDLNKFYKGYIAVYWNPKTQEISGRRNGNEKQIITAMNKPDIQQEFGYQKIA